MKSQRLRETLTQLRRELAASDDGDTETRERVQEAADALDAWLERAEEPDGGLGERLQEAALRFEEEHPNLSGAVRRVVDALSDLGI